MIFAFFAGYKTRELKYANTKTTNHESTAKTSKTKGVPVFPARRKIKVMKNKYGRYSFNFIAAYKFLPSVSITSFFNTNQQVIPK